MGGKAFSSGSNALYTPRMAPQVYGIILANCFNALTLLFSVVKNPIEAPEKATFGDIDLVVSLEDSSFTSEDINDHQKAAIWTTIEQKLEAVRVFQEGRLYTSKSMAISWPTDLSEDVMADQLAVESIAGHKAESEWGKASSKAVETSHEAETKNRYVQVDIQLCLSDQDLEWRLFKHDHGDLWNMLGAMIRPYGLTANEEALCIRIPEMEQIDKKKSRVFLTSSPAKVLEFIMAEDCGEWAKRFSSVNAMFDYTSKCKWFYIWLALENDKNNTKVREGLKANDRQRMSQRPVFARWVEEYVRRQIDLNRSFFDSEKRTATDIREGVRNAAFATFPGAEERYNQQLATWNKERTRIFVKNKLIKEDMSLPESIACALPTPQEGSSAAEVEKNWRGVLRSALTKLIVNESTDFESVGITPPRVRDKYGVLIVDEVKDWIEKNWEVVGRAAWVEQCARAAESIRIKEAKQRLQELEIQRVEGSPVS